MFLRFAFIVLGITLATGSVADAQERPRVLRLDGVFSVALSPDGKTALSGGGDETLRLWNLTSGREIRKFQGSGVVYSVAIAPDGKTALSGGGDDTLRLWDLASGREIRKFEGHSGPVSS